MIRSAAQILVDQLIAQGVERATCVPGESYLAVLDALVDSGIDLLTCRAEGGAAMMAETYGKLTGQPGICFVTRGPGATNAAPGLHIAMQDSTPMILFVGQVARDMRHREAFQELDYRQSFAGLAKWLVEIDDAARIPELIARAFRTAMQGRPGPVVVALPEDMLVETANVEDAPKVVPVVPAPAPEDIAALGDLLRKAERPLLIAGGSRWSADACAALTAFAKAHDLPVGCAFRRAMLFPADDARFVGDLGIGPNPVLAQAVRDADLLILLGTRMSEIASSGYTLIDAPLPRQRLVHIHPDPMEIGRVYQPAVGINATPGSFLAAAKTLTSDPGWSEHRSRLRSAYLDWSETPQALPGAFQYGEVMVWLRERLPADAILTNGAGNYASWLHRYYRFRAFGTQLAPTSGSMGYGVPAAVMAKRMHPYRIVMCLAGDGDFLMNGQEFATACQYGIALIVIVVDNGMYGTIRMHQEREYPGRVSATNLSNPDFAALGRAYGGHGETVRDTAEFAPAFERALASGRPAILHCFLDPQAITPTATLDAIREAAEQRKA